MKRPESSPQGDPNHLLPDPSAIKKIIKDDFYYRHGFHRTEFGRELLRDKIRAESTIIEFRIAHPELPHNDILLRDSLTERAVMLKLVSLGDIIPFSKLETIIFDKDTPPLPE